MQANTKSTSTSTAVTSPPAQSTACLPCDIPPFCRSHFYTGKLLTEGDLTREQHYAMDKMRLHYTALHGWGVVCGLMVQPHPNCVDRFVVTPGFAVDDCGREIRLLKGCVIEFPKPPARLPEPCPPEPCEDEEDSEPVDRGQTYYVCIRYSECREDFMPVIFDECCGSTKQPNRICECAEVQLLTEPPECLEEIGERRHCRDRNCHELWEELPVHCPPTGQVCCVPLAIIREYVYCETLTEAMIDNSIRPILPSAARLEELIHCLMDHLPKALPKLTHIARFNWDHDREYGHGEFLREFVGSHESPEGFELEFDRRVHSRGLNNRTFRAMVVREAENHDPRRVEIAPARVTRSEDGFRCMLHIDPDYARRHLHEHNFDLFITLHCDKVIDEHGLAVDGDLLADLPHDEEGDYSLKQPTGNGVPGGLFESWIRVRRGR